MTPASAAAGVPIPTILALEARAVAGDHGAVQDSARRTAIAQLDLAKPESRRDAGVAK